MEKLNMMTFDKKLIELKTCFDDLQRWILVLPLQNPNIPYSEIHSTLLQIEQIHSQIQTILVNLYKQS